MSPGNFNTVFLKNSDSEDSEDDVVLDSDAEDSEDDVVLDSDAEDSEDDVVLNSDSEDSEDDVSEDDVVFEIKSDSDPVAKTERCIVGAAGIVKTQAQQENPPKIKIRANYVKTIDLSKECLILTKFTFKTVAENAALIVGVGGITKAVLAFIPDENSVMAKLKELGKELKKNIDALSDKMNNRFDGMEAFISESRFYELSMPNLTKYMENCIDDPKNEEATENFRKSYDSDSPLNMTYSVIRLFENDVTNPLKKAMNADPLKTKTTFEKWVDIIDKVLAHFLFLESYARGRLQKTSTYDQEQIRNEKKKLFKLIDLWRKYYKKDESYWPELKKYIEQYQDSHKHLSLDQKADEVKKTLETILTNDAFIVVFSPNGFFSHGVLYCYTTVEEQLIESRNRGNCSVIIYRSKLANFVRERKFDEMEWRLQMSVCCMPPFDWPPENKNSSDENRVPNAGLLCVVGKFEEVRSANCPRRSQGPLCIYTFRHGGGIMEIPITTRNIAGYR